MSRAQAAREGLAAALAGITYDGDELLVFPDFEPIAVTGRAFVALDHTTVEPGRVASGARVYAITVSVVVPLTLPGQAAEDVVDEVLDLVLEQLDAAGVDWSKAERGTWRDGNHPAYLIETEWSE